MIEYLFKSTRSFNQWGGQNYGQIKSHYCWVAHSFLFSKLRSHYLIQIINFNFTYN